MSAAGPAPNYDMQKILSTRSPSARAARNRVERDAAAGEADGRTQEVAP